MTLVCAGCGRRLDVDRVGVRDVCPGCGAWLHACRQCALYAPGLAHDCREPSAEPVADETAGNFCDWYRPAVAAAAEAPKPESDPRARLEALFKKR